MKYFILLFLISTSLLFHPQKDKQIIIVIDAGHGGNDSGAIGKHFNTKEKDINLSVAKYLYKYLKQNSKFHPILTRNKDVFIPLKKRAEISNYFKPDLFISLHCNQPGTNNNFHSNGSEVYYLKDSKIKDSINQRKSVLIALNILEDLQSSLNFNKRKVLSSNFSVLRNTNKISPSILVEIAYLSNYSDEIYIKEKNNQEAIALSIYKTITHQF